MSRRPQISAPTNFRHLHSETFAFPSLPQQDQQDQVHQFHQYQHEQQQQFREQQQAFQQQYLQRYQQHYRQQYQQHFQRRPPSFQPLNFTHLPSPLFSSFQRATGAEYGNGGATDEDIIMVPPRVHTRDGSHGDDDNLSINLAQLDRSYSTMSFHVPRRAIGGGAASGGSVLGSVRSGRTGSRGNVNGASTLHIHSSGAGASAGAADAYNASQPPTIPQRSRLRSHSSPGVDSMVERIASALIEVERLQAEIDSVIERQSIYISSRPSTAYETIVDGGRASTALGAFEMPSVPAMPAAAPSFAERLSTERPKTAPPRSSTYFPPVEDEIQHQELLLQQQQPQQQTHYTPVGSTTIAGSSNVSLASAASVASAAAKAAKAKAKAAAVTTASMRGGGSSGCGPRINGHPIDVPLAPPLPLVLRPPLRKKKSFSRVSSWLSFHQGGDGFLGGNGHHSSGLHERGMSFDSVTNQPQPVTQRDGFYQCIPPSQATGDAGDKPRTSLDSFVSTVDTLSTWTTEREEAEKQQLENERADGEEKRYRPSPVSVPPQPMYQPPPPPPPQAYPMPLTTTWSPSSSLVSSPVSSSAATAATAARARLQDSPTPTPTSATTTTTTLTSTLTATLTATTMTTAAEKPGSLLASHRPQSVGVAF